MKIERLLFLKFLKNWLFLTAIFGHLTRLMKKSLPFLWSVQSYLQSEMFLSNSVDMMKNLQQSIKTVLSTPPSSMLRYLIAIIICARWKFLKIKDTFWKWLNSKMNDKQIYVTNWKQFVLIFWAVWDLQWLRSTWVCNIPGPTEHMEALRIRPFSLLYDV